MARVLHTQIGKTVANDLLGYNAKATTLGGGLAGAVFAFVAGLAGTFTACNVAAFSAVGPMMGAASSTGTRIRRVLPQIGWLSAGLIVVAAVYGAVGAAIGDSIPQLNTHTVGNNVPVRIIQSAVVFTVIGLAFVWLGLAAIEVVPDPLRRLTARWPQTPAVVMGALIGGAFMVFYWGVRLPARFDYGWFPRMPWR